MDGESSCAACGASCRPSDHFCSQCGRRDPASRIGEQTVPSLGSHAALVAAPAVGEATDDSPLQPGTIFARRYHIERMLGEGGMGRVYLATDTTIDEPIALKFVSSAHQSNHGILEQFKRELKLARKVRHRNVVASFHLGEAEGRSYITQEYINADSLSLMLERSGPLGEPQALGLLRQVLRGVKAAHDLGIVHRDIKASNILVNKEGMAFITDFGLAFSASQRTSLQMAGTPQYMAPELLEGAPPTPSTDLYACGILLFHMLTGRFPFAGPYVSELTRRPPRVDPDAIPTGVHVSAVTREVYGRLLAGNPKDRPQRAVDVLEQVESVLALDALRITTERPIALVGEVDEPVREAAREQLERDGYHVEAVSTAEAVVALAFARTPSLVVIDANIDGGQRIALAFDASSALANAVLPQRGGLGLCQLLQHDGRLKRVPILVLTAQPPARIMPAFILVGAAAVMAKPFTREGFAAGVRRARQTALARGDEG